MKRALGIGVVVLSTWSCGDRVRAPGAPTARTVVAMAPIVNTTSTLIFGAPHADFARCLSGPGDAACFSGVRPVDGVATAPASAPDAPVNLVATASGTSVTLVWTAPGSGDPVTTYVIEAGSATGLANLANSPTNSTATVFSAGGVGNGTYFVRAVAVNAFGQSPASNEVVVTVGIPTTFAGQWVSVAPDGIVFPGSGFCSAIIASGTFSTNRLTTTGTYIPSRTWVDANRNLLPDCDLFSPAQNGECGAALTSGQSLTLTATR